MKTLPDDQFSDVITATKLFPHVVILNHKFEVLGEPAIIPHAIVTLSMKLVEIFGEDPPDGTHDTTIEPQEEGAGKKSWWEKNNKGAPAYAPFYPAKRIPNWYVGLANGQINRLISMNKVNDLQTPKTVTLQFQAPPNPGSWTFQLIIKSDSYVGMDQFIDVKFTVKHESAAPLLDEEDDISEADDVIHAPEEEHKTKKRGERGEFDDSDDSEFFEEQDSPSLPEDFIE